jgi:hypothetical protein
MKVTSIGNNKTEFVTSSGCVVLVSYSTPVACLENGKFYRTEEKFSVTTSKHINQWLGGVVAEYKPQNYFRNLLNQG